jgi:hypothetical protein
VLAVHATHRSVRLIDLALNERGPQPDSSDSGIGHARILAI